MRTKLTDNQCEILRSLLTAIEAVAAYAQMPADSSDLARVECIHLRRLFNVAELAKLAPIAPDPCLPLGGRRGNGI